MFVELNTGYTTVCINLKKVTVFELNGDLVNVWTEDRAFTFECQTGQLAEQAYDKMRLKLIVNQPKVEVPTNEAPILVEFK